MPSVSVPDDIWSSFQSDQLAQRSQAMLDGLKQKFTDAVATPAPSPTTLAPQTGLPSLDALLSPFAPAAQSLGAAAVSGPDVRTSAPAPTDTSSSVFSGMSQPAAPDVSTALPSLQSLPALGSLVASATPAPIRSALGQVSASPTLQSAAPSAAPASSGPIDNSSRASFARTAYPAALSAAGGDPELAKRLLASAISENGTVGSGGPIGVGYNFGGIKYDPQASGSGAYGTWESEGGQRVNQDASFAHYDSPEAGFAAIPRFIQKNFPKAWATYQQTHDAAGLYRDINAGGYATDPNWARTIEGIASQQVAPAVQGLRQDASSVASRQPALTSGPPPAPSGGALDADGIVKAYANTSYTYGGPGGRTAGFGAPTDCSGFVSAIYQNQYGLDLVPHTDGAYNQLKQLGASEVKTQDARPGDVVFYMGAGTGGAITHHMGVYAGDGKVLDDSVSGADGVHVRDVGHAGQYVILRDPRLNAQTPASASAPPPIQPTGLAEQTGGAKVNQQQLAQAATSQPGGPPWTQADASQSGAAAAPPSTFTASARAAPDPTMYRQPLSQTATSPDTTPSWQDDQTQSGYVQPDMAPGPPVPDMSSGGPSGAAAAVDTSGPDLGPLLPPQPSFPQRVVDTASAIPGAIQSGLQAANTAASTAVDSVTGGISQAGQELGSALTAAGLPNVPAIVSHVGGMFVGPEAGIVGVSKAGQRAQEIDQQAADWLLAQGRISPARATVPLGAANDAAWRAANPDLAAEYDDLQSQLTMTVGGMVGAGGEHPSPEGAPRAGEPAAASRPETTVAPGNASPPDVGTSARPAPSAAVENAHAALDTLESQGLDVATARAALPERPVTPDVTPGPSPVSDVTPEVTPPAQAPSAEPGRIPGAGYYDPSTTTPEAADLVRQQRADYEANDLTVVPRAETARRAEQTLSLEPGTIERWQQEQLDAARDPGAAPAQGGALRLAAYGDAEAAIEAQRRFDTATAELHDHIAAGNTAESAPPELKQRLAEATADLAELRQRLSTSARASSAHGTAAARILNERQNAVSARGAFQLVERGDQLAADARAAAEAARTAAENGAVDEPAAAKLRQARTRLAESVSEKGQARSAAVEDRLSGIEQQAERARQQVRQKRGQAKTPAPRADRPPPLTETLEERLGRLKREHGYAEDGGDTAKATDLQSQVDDTLAEMRARAAEEAQKVVNRTQKPLTPEEAQRAVDRAIGRRASSRINKEARAQASGQAQGEFLSRFDQSLGKKIDAALAKDRKLQAQAQVGDLASTARDWHQRSLGDPANEAFRREEATALAKLEQHSTLGKATADDLRQRFEANRSEAGFKFRSDMEKRIADAEKQRTGADRQQNLKDLRAEAKTWLDRAIKEPGNPHIEEQFQQAAENLARHSQQGGEHAMTLIGKLANAKDEASFKFHADMEKRVADQARKDAAATQREVEASRIRGVVAQIDEVLKNPHAPGMAERLQQLHADLTEVSQKGFEKSSDLRRRLQEKNLLRVGMEKGADLDLLVKALAKVDPNDPASIRPVLAAIARPTTMGILREMQYVNMLSSPITHGVNASSNAMQIAGRLLVNNPLEFIGSRGASSGTGAAFEGAASGVRRGAELAKTVMRTGVNPDALERAIETGSVGNVGRELLTEKFGKLGAALHAVSTRPLEAMDAMLGHVVYSSVIEQEAQRLADRMLASGAAEVKGMNRQAAADFIKAHVWDYPEIIQKAGKIQDYTLLKSHDVGEGVGGRLEQGLRGLVGKRYLPEKPTFTDHALSALFDIALPFFNVPLNFTKQGIERTAGAFYQPFKFAGAVGAERAAATPAERAAARTAQGEAFAKAGISAGILTSAISLAMNDSLTGDGPTDPAKRAIWAENHQPHSVRIPGTGQWVSYDGTPLAVPFAAVAGAMDEFHNAQQAPGNQQLSGTDAAVKFGLGAAKGTAKGVLSQSFLQGIQDQYNALANPSEAGLSREIAGTASRAVPLGGMVSWLARMTDGIQRDTGRAQVGSDLPANIGAQLASRIPGLREQLNPRLGAYGEDTANPQAGIAGALPYYRGPGQNQDDPLTRHLEASNVGTVLAPRSMPISLGPGTNQSVEIPLNAAEQRAYQQIAGQEFRRLLEQNPNSGTMSQAGLVQIRGAARQIAEQRVQQQIGADEIRRRLQPGLSALQQKAG